MENLNPLCVWEIKRQLFTGFEKMWKKLHLVGCNTARKKQTSINKLVTIN